MLSWDQAQITSQEFASDDGSDTIISLNRYLNLGYKLVLAALSRPNTERTRTSSTVGSQQYYQTPPDYLYMKSMTVTVGGIAYPVYEEESQDIWNILNANQNQTSDIPVKFFIRESFGISGIEFGLYPIPASANIITMVYEATDKDMSQTAYNSGTVSLTNGSATVTGSSTTFSANMVGRYFNVTSNTGDGLWYKVVSYTSPTSITLENFYDGSNISGVSYQICEIFALPEEMQILPCYYSAAHYYHIKHDKQERDDYWTLFTDGLKEGMKRHATKSRSNKIGGGVKSRWPIWAPIMWPQTVT